MNRSPLTSDRVVTRASHFLSARRPVSVRRDFFPRKDGSLPIDLEGLAAVCPYRCYFSRQRYVAPHRHEHCEIFFVLNGSAVHRTMYYRAPLQKGDVVFALQGQVHAIDHIDGLHRVGCAYLPEWLARDAEDLALEPGVLPFLLGQENWADAKPAWVLHLHVASNIFDACLHEVRAIAEELERDFPSLPYLRRCMGKILVLLGRSLGELREKPSAPAFRGEVVRVLQLVEQHVLSGQPFQLPAFAETTGFSVSHLIRLFREFIGLSPMNYYQQRRIIHACWMLLHTDLSITEIAFALGYSDTSHFIRHFHKLRKESPKSYRERFRQNGD